MRTMPRGMCLKRLYKSIASRFYAVPSIGRGSMMVAMFRVINLGAALGSLHCGGAEST